MIQYKLGFMRGSRNFRQGGGGVQVSLAKKALTTVFFVFFSPQLIYRSQMVNFKEIYHFSRFQRGSKILWGGGGPITYSYRNPYNGSALGFLENFVCSHYQKLNKNSKEQKMGKSKVFLGKCALLKGY